jgi:hypothetical protein
MGKEQEIKEVKRRHSAWMLRQPGVCGFGIEKDENGILVLTVHLDSTKADAGTTVPELIDGFPVKRLRSGPFAKR